MKLTDLKKELYSLKNALDTAIKQNINLSMNIKKDIPFTDFKARKTNYQVKTIEYHLDNLSSLSLDVRRLKEENKSNSTDIDKMSKMLSSLKKGDARSMLKEIDALINIAEKLRFPEPKRSLIMIPTNIPSDVKEEVVADLKELDKCYAHSCYRSCVILCGRLLEVALHRKYYDATGIDILEKSPGIGLGNLIAKMKAKDIDIEPGLTQQIHLINNVRVFSVHKKQKPFNPSSSQTQAIILFTIDTLEKLF